MVVSPVGKIKLSHLLFGSDGVGHAKVGTPVRVIVTDDAQLLSVAVATPSSSSSSIEHELVKTDTSGGACSTGGVVSEPAPTVTVILCVQDATRPMSSVAVQVMVVRPAGNGSVNGRSSLLRLVMVTPVPVVVGVPMSAAVTVASHPETAVNVLSLGHVMVGASGDVTITRC